MNIDVTITPLDTLPNRVLHRNIAVIDVFRATTVIITALDNGARKIIPVSSVEEALDIKEVLSDRGEGVITAGERNAVQIDGFDRDNSPLSFMDSAIKDKSIVMTTTNGTRAINASRLGSNIFIAAFINVTSVSKKLLSYDRDITIVCAGRNDQFTLEDALCAGMIIDYIDRNIGDKELTFTDIARNHRDIYRLYSNNLNTALADTSHYKALQSLELDKDIEYCLQCDITTTVPFLDNHYQILKSL